MINAENNTQINKIYKNELNPSIDYVSLPYKQNFENVITSNGVTVTKDNNINGVSKVTIKFNREEDMILMCLSLFVHDYIHDYNLDTMHGRVINKNTELFKSLNIKVGLQYFKTFSYVYNENPRDIKMYNDNEYRDLNEEQQKNIFDFDRNEIVNTSNKQIGGEEGPFTLKKEFVTIPNKSEFENENKSEFENEFEFESKSENEFENKEINESNEEKIEDYLINP